MKARGRRGCGIGQLSQVFRSVLFVARELGRKELQFAIDLGVERRLVGT